MKSTIFFKNTTPELILAFLFSASILPLIDYGSVTQVSTSCANLERLAKLQNCKKKKKKEDFSMQYKKLSYAVKR